MLFTVSIFVLNILLCSADAQRCITVVMPDTNVLPISDCCCSGYDHPCLSLETGLKCIEKHKNNIELYINGLSHTVNRSFIFGRVQNVTIVGVSGNSVSFPNELVKITCNKSFETGLLFTNVYNVTIMNVSLQNCTGSSNVSSQAGAIVFVDSYNITLHNMVILFSYGYGVILNNLCGFIKISNSWLTDNEGGVRLIFNDDNCECYAYVLIENIIALNNNVINNGNEGGGISMIINKSFLHISISSSQFFGNKARCGGGLFIQLTGNASENVISVIQSHFILNQYYTNATPDLQYQDSRGGGIRLVFNTTNTNNSITFNDCTVRSNTAAVGAGLSIISSHTNSIKASKNIVILSETTIADNTGIIGSAFHAESMKDQENGFTLTLVIQNSMIRKNHVSDTLNQTIGLGVAFCNNIQVHFHKKNVLDQNHGSALAISATSVHFLEHSETHFTHNQGINGGAIAFINMGYMVIHDYSKLIFQENTAFIQGGAIAVTGFGEMNYVTKYYPACFVKYHSNMNTTQLWFSFNKAKGQLNSIFVPSLEQCYIKSEKSSVLCSKQWMYHRSNCSANIKTLAAKMLLTNQNGSVHEVYSGTQTRLPIMFVDDLGHDVTVDTALLADYTNNQIHLDHNSIYISNGLCTLYRPVSYSKNSSSVFLKLYTLSPRLLAEDVNITFLPCPPGYKEVTYKETTDNIIYTKCECADFIAAMVKCNQSSLHLQASLYDAFCITPDPKYNTTMTYLFVECIFSLRNSQHAYHYNLLPTKSSDFDDLCGQQQRKGYFCSECIQSNGVDTNSLNYNCIECPVNEAIDIVKNIFLYSIVKFLPVIVMFLIIILFQVNLTSAPLNLYIWFCQSLSLPENINSFQSHFATNVVATNPWLTLLFLPLGIWNFNFFQFFFIKVCISPHLKILHVLTLEYLTALCPLLLIIISYVCIELHGNGVRIAMCIWKPFEKCIRLFRKNWKAKNSTIDVFASFVLLSYTKFTDITFSLLLPNPVFNSNGKIVYYVTHLDPSVHYCSTEHMPFFVLAIVVLIIGVLFPPLLLLIYSFTCCNRIQHFIPSRYHLALCAFVDAFQGGFKDGTNGTNNCRYVASIYLLLRVFSVVLRFLTWNIEIERMAQFLMMNAVLLVIVFVQPYKRTINNNIDIAIMILMGCIIAISSYYADPNSAHIDSLYIEVLFVFLIFLLPFCFTSCMFYMILKALFQMLKQLIESKHCSVDNSETTPLLLNQCIEDSLPDRITNPDSYN